MVCDYSRLTTHGDLYHEGKEFEVKLREMKPGTLSQELKEALSMLEGAPPPWLINMQRYGMIAPIMNSMCLAVVVVVVLVNQSAIDDHLEMLMIFSR